MHKLILISILSLFLSSCSFLPKLTMNRTTTALPVKTEKSEKSIRCSGDIILDNLGRVQSCTKGYSANESYYNQSERRFTLFEKIGNFFANLKGWFGILVIGSIILTLMGGGGIAVTIWSNIFGTATKGLKALVYGIQKGKKYVRDNGDKYSDVERKIYQQGANDMLVKISEAIDDKQVKKMINLIRAELD